MSDKRENSFVLIIFKSYFFSFLISVISSFFVFRLLLNVINNFVSMIYFVIVLSFILEIFIVIISLFFGKFGKKSQNNNKRVNKKSSLIFKRMGLIFFVLNLILISSFPYSAFLTFENIYFSFGYPSKEYFFFLKNIKNKKEKTFYKLLHYWYGTEWGFYGTTRIPRKGRIACGHFVATTLYQSGLRINHRAVGMQPASKIIKMLCEKRSIKWFSKDKYLQIKEYLKVHGEGFYIIGLDKHVGFLYYSGKEAYFIHSNGFIARPRQVIRERFRYSLSIKFSKVINIGKLYFR